MGITFDTTSGITQGTTDRNWPHAPTDGATPQGVLVLVSSTAGTDEVVSVTYNSVAMNEIALSPVLLAGGEAGSVHGFFLGSGLPAGTQTIAVDAGASSWGAQAYSVFADGDTIIEDTSTSSSTATTAPGATLTISHDSFVAGGLYSGENNPGSTAGAGLTVNDRTLDFGTDTGAFTHGDSIKTTDFSFVWSQASNDGITLVVAIRQKQQYASAQAQADIKTTYYANAQSQADILATYYVLAQAQSNIKQTYYGLAQAQATLIGWGFAQSQADIKAVDVGFAQSQANIKATTFTFAQAQADIQQGYYILAQTQTIIKQTYYEFAQSQADIQTTYYELAQAQARINALDLNAHAQANASIVVIVQVFARTQARLIAFDINAFAQAQATISSVAVFASAQTQAAIGITLNIYQFIEEIAPTDNDYITTDYNPSGIIYEAQLTELYTPLYPIHHFVRVRAWKAGTKSSTITVTLYDAGVSVGSWIIVPTITPTNYEFALTSSEIAAITDYSALALRFTFDTTGGGTNTRLYVTWTEFEAPLGPTKVYKRVAQAQAAIKTVSYVWAQAQAKIAIAETFVSAQAQAD